MKNIEEQYEKLKGVFKIRLAHTQQLSSDSYSRNLTSKTDNLMLKLMITDNMIRLVLSENNGNGWFPIRIAKYDKITKEFMKSYFEMVDGFMEQIIALEGMGIFE